MKNTEMKKKIYYRGWARAEQNAAQRSLPSKVLHQAATTVLSDAQIVSGDSGRIVRKVLTSLTRYSIGIIEKIPNQF